MGEIKSAWEIAQMKAGKLGNLSPAELKKQREDRCQLIGTSVAEKYLEQDGTQYLEAELDKHDSSDKELIIHAAIERLTEGINLSNRLMLDKISQGIRSMTHGKTTETINRLEALAQEYNEADDKERQEINRNGKEILHQLRISGTAIGQINILANKDWQEKIDQMGQPYKERLSQLKQEILGSSRGH